MTILEKCERLSNLDRDQPQMLRSIANTLTDLLVSLVAFITTLIQMLIRFLNAGATVTNNRCVLQKWYSCIWLLISSGLSTEFVSLDRWMILYPQCLEFTSQFIEASDR